MPPCPARSGNGAAPDPWLIRSAPALLGLAGPILDLACGRGRNAVWLARRGSRVVGVDVAAEAIAAARRASRPTPATFRQLEVRPDSFPRGPWAAILVFHYLDRCVFPHLQETLIPGGLLVYKTHLSHRLRSPDAHPRRRSYLLGSGELLSGFPSLVPLDYREWTDDGGAYAALLARRAHSS